MKVAAGILEYADPDGLYRCLGSLGLDKGGIDLAIVIHGKFAGFDLEDPNALEETKTIISRFPPNIKLVQAPSNSTEIEMRNLYMKTAAEEGCDWLLVIDSDEFVAHKVADWKTFRSQLQFVMSLELDHQIFDIQFEGTMPIQRGPRPRLFYRPGTIKYWQRHYWWVLEEKMICLKGMSDAGRIIGGIFLLHDHTIRSSKHYDASLGYKVWQENHEGTG